MRAAPKITEFSRFPIVAGTAMLAIGVTLAGWSNLDISPLYATPMIRRGELWRLVTSIFPHAGVLHLIFNLYWLWAFGTLIEEIYGHFKTVALVLLFAAGSSAFEFAFAIGGVGLSGVGYGLFGLLWVLSRHDERFRDAVDEKTVQLFVIWFFFCIVTTVAHIFPVANIAHGSGAALGALTGVAIVHPRRRAIYVAGIAVVLVFVLWASTLGRPRINLSGRAGYEEGEWGYDALEANHNQEAARWLRDAAIYQPKLPVYWFDLGIAYQRLGNESAARAAYQKAHDLAPGELKYSEALDSLN